MPILFWEECRVCHSRYNTKESRRVYGNIPTDNNCCTPSCYTEFQTGTSEPRLSRPERQVRALYNKDLLALCKELTGKTTWENDSPLRKWINETFVEEHSTGTANDHFLLHIASSVPTLFLKEIMRRGIFSFGQPQT